MKTTTKRIIFGILIIINCATIFYFSNQVADNSSQQSSRIVKLVSDIVPSIKKMKEPEKTTFKEEVLTPIIRKTAHLSIYAMLGIWTINFINTFEKLKISKKVIISLLFCMLYAITDEFHQTLVPGRSGEIRDVLIDSLGALTGMMLILLISKIIQKIKQKQLYEAKGKVPIAPKERKQIK